MWFLNNKTENTTTSTAIGISMPQKTSTKRFRCFVVTHFTGLVHFADP